MKPAAIHCWTLWLLACCPSPGGAQEAAPGPRGAASSTLLAALASTRRLSLDNPPPALAAEAAVIEAALERLHGRGVVLPVEGDSQGGPGPPEVGSSPEAASNSPGAGPQGHSSRPGEEEGGAGPAPGGGAEWRPLLEVTSVDVKKRRHKARTTVVIVEPAPPEDDLPRVRQWEPGEGDGEAEAAAPPPAGEPGAAGALAPAGAPAGPLSEEAAEGQREKGLLGSTAAGPAAAGSGLPATAVAAGPGKPEVVRGHNGSLDGAVAAAGGSDARRPDMVDVNESLAVGVIVGVAVGSAAVASLLLGLGIFLLRRHRWRRRLVRNSDPEAGTPGAGLQRGQQQGVPGLLAGRQGSSGGGGGRGLLAALGLPAPARKLGQAHELAKLGGPAPATGASSPSPQHSIPFPMGAGAALSSASSGAGAWAAEASLATAASGSMAGPAAGEREAAGGFSDGGGGFAQPGAPMAVLPESDLGLREDQVEIVRRQDSTPWVLGRGSYGTVYKGLLDGVQPVAVKVVQGMGDRWLREAFLREVALLRVIRHRNVLQFIGACFVSPAGGAAGAGPTAAQQGAGAGPEQEAEALLVTEFMERGDLWRLLPLRNTAGQRVLGWYARGRRVALDIALGLHHLHTLKVLHLDLKSANCLITRDGTAKVADVGMSRALGAGRSHLSTSIPLGTLAWSAPEVLTGQRCTDKADIFSLGIVIWEVCTGRTPVRGDMRELRVPEDCPAEVADLVARCTAPGPAARPTAREVVLALERLQSPPAGPGGRQAQGEERLLDAAAAAADAAADQAAAGAAPSADGRAQGADSAAAAAAAAAAGADTNTRPSAAAEQAAPAPAILREGSGSQPGAGAPAGEELDGEAAAAAAWALAMERSRRALMMGSSP